MLYHSGIQGTAPVLCVVMHLFSMVTSSPPSCSEVMNFIVECCSLQYFAVLHLTNNVCTPSHHPYNCPIHMCGQSNVLKAMFSLVEIKVYVSSTTRI